MSAIRAGERVARAVSAGELRETGSVEPFRGVPLNQRVRVLGGKGHDILVCEVVLPLVDSEYRPHVAGDPDRGAVGGVGGVCSVCGRFVVALGWVVARVRARCSRRAGSGGTGVGPSPADASSAVALPSAGEPSVARDSPSVVTSVVASRASATSSSELPMAPASASALSPVPGASSSSPDGVSAGARDPARAGPSLRWRSRPSTGRVRRISQRCRVVRRYGVSRRRRCLAGEHVEHAGLVLADPVDEVVEQLSFLRGHAVGVDRHVRRRERRELDDLADATLVQRLRNLLGGLDLVRHPPHVVVGERLCDLLGAAVAGRAQVGDVGGHVVVKESRRCWRLSLRRSFAWADLSSSSFIVRGLSAPRRGPSGRPPRTRARCFYRVQL